MKLTDNSSQFLSEMIDSFYANSAGEPKEILPLITLATEAGLYEKAIEIKEAWIESNPAAKGFFSVTDDTDFSGAELESDFNKVMDEEPISIEQHYQRVADTFSSALKHNEELIQANRMQERRAS